MTTKIKAFNLSDFYTLPIAQAGKKLPLAKPDGSATEYHLVVIGADATDARASLLKASRTLRDEIKDDDPEDKKVAVTERATLEFRASLVTGWNLPVERTEEAVLDLLENNPGLAQEIEKFSGDRKRFFASESAS